MVPSGMIEVAAAAAGAGLYEVSLPEEAETVQFCSGTAQARQSIGFALRHFRNEQNGTDGCIGRCDFIEEYGHTAHMLPLRTPTHSRSSFANAGSSAENMPVPSSRGAGHRPETTAKRPVYGSARNRA